jgi:hypothetical protein
VKSPRDTSRTVLFVHAAPLSAPGGAELSLAQHVREAPEGVEIDEAALEEDRSLGDYDAVVLGNLRPSGGLGEEAETEPALRWVDRLKSFKGFSLKSERDVHPCTHRDARCIVGPRLRHGGCDCSPRMRDVFSELYDSCSAVQFLSPAHKRVINQLTRSATPQYVIAPPIEFSRFQATTPWHRRGRTALILGDEIRVAPTATERAIRAGYEPQRIPYLSVPYEDMPKLYNEHRAVVVDPVMFHAFGRVAVEAMCCGCKVLASNRVGATSWWNPRRACRQANQRFWRLILDGCRRNDRHRAL